MHEYVLRNQDISWEAVKAIETGNIEELARSMKRAQQLFDICAIPVRYIFYNKYILASLDKMW